MRLHKTTSMAGVIAELVRLPSGSHPSTEPPPPHPIAAVPPISAPRAAHFDVHGTGYLAYGVFVNMSVAPAVLFPLTLAGLLHYLLSTQSETVPTKLIVCSSRDTFLEHLSDSLRQHGGADEADRLEALVTPTLFNLFTSRHIRLVFCASVQALLVYLTAYSRPGTRHVGNSEGRERLVLVNPLALHASTSAYSAQGLSRTFATAAETASRTGAMLRVVECKGVRRKVDDHDEDTTMEEDAVEGPPTIQEDEEEEKDPWDQELSILNVSARRFGSGSRDRAWAGRTVKAKRIAGRWFLFHQLVHNQTPQVAE